MTTITKRTGQTNIVSSNSLGNISIIDNVGNIYVIGQENLHPQLNFYIIKFSPQGDLDETFGTNGKNIFYTSNVYLGEEKVNSVVLSSDGNSIYVGGHIRSTNHTFRTNFIVFQLDLNGDILKSLETDFENNSNDYSKSLLIDKDDNIYIIGNVTTFIGTTNTIDKQFVGIIKLTSNLELDTTFGDNNTGKKMLENISIDNTNLYTDSVKLDKDDKIYVAGINMNDGSLQTDSSIIIKLNKDGNLVEDFGDNGSKIVSISDDSFDQVKALAIDADTETIFVAGNTNVNKNVKIDPYGSIGITEYSKDIFAMSFDANDGNIVEDFGVDGVVTFNNSETDYDVHSIGYSDEKLTLAATASVTSDSGITLNTELIQLNANNGSLNEDYGDNGSVSVSYTNANLEPIPWLDHQNGYGMVTETIRYNDSYETGIQLTKLTARGELAKDFGNEVSVPILEYYLEQSSKNTYFF
jgi:uncharacterized delta-60 repeat protein